MNKVWHVAWREFRATAMTKGFIIGAIFPLVLLVFFVIVFPLLYKREPPAVAGTLAIIDPTGRIAADVAERLRPEAIAARKRTRADALASEVEERAGKLATEGHVGNAVRTSLEQELARVPQIEVATLPAGSDVEKEKAELRAETEDKGKRLGLAVIEPHAVSRPEGAGRFGSFVLYIRAKLDDRVEDEMRTALIEAIKAQRILAAAHDPEEITALITVDAPRTREVTEGGERDALGEWRQFVSFGFMGVLMLSAMLGGQYLLTTTVEEKSSRVVEILLSALSPMELMAGKILGQLGVGLSILILYGGLGGGALLLYGLADLFGVLNVVYLLVFFLIAYCTVGALLAAVGSAVNDMREAQSLQMPVMISFIIPYMLWFPISRDPNSTFATVCSFIPPIGPMVMMLRVTSTEPPPLWQVLLSIGVGFAGVYVAFWAAAKIFRIGLLMFGKPPNLLTLIKWVRMA